MRVSQVIPRGTFYFDRNATTFASYFAVTGYDALPDWQTVKMYTPPNGRLAFISAIYIRVRRATESTSPGTIGARVVVAPVGGNQITLAQAEVNTNIVGDQTIKERTYHILLQPGTYCYIDVIDTSGDGTADFEVSVFIVEFDG